MDIQKIKELLSEYQAKTTTKVAVNSPFRHYSGGYAVRGSNLAMNLAPFPKPIKRQIQCPNLGWQRIEAALSRCGDVVESDFNRGCFAVVIMAGIENGNPAVVVVSYDDTTLYMEAYAREGLIRQNTADAAMDKIENELGTKNSRV